MRCLACFALAALLLSVGPGEAAQKAKATPCEPGEICVSGLSGEDLLVIARNLIEAGQLREAREVLSALVYQPHLRNEREFLTGLVDLDMGDYDAAIKAFRRVLADRPELARVRLELAKALFLARRDRKADYHFRLALAEDPPTDVADGIRRYRRIIQERRRWTFGVEFGVVPDSNANAAPDDETVRLFGLPFELSEDARESAQLGILTGGRIEGRLPLAERTRLFLSAQGRHVEYGSGAFDDSVVSVVVGPQFATRWGILIPAATYFRRWFDGSSYNMAYGGRLSWRKSLSSRWAIEAFVAGSYVDYAFDDGLDGPLFGVGATLEQHLGSRSFIDYFFAAQRQNAKSKARARTEGIVAVGYGREIPWGVTLYGRGEVLVDFFDAAQAAFGRTRRDQRVGLSLTLTKRDWSWLGFAPLIRYRYSHNFSNIDLFRFNRHRGELGLTRVF